MQRVSILFFLNLRSLLMEMFIKKSFFLLTFDILYPGQKWFKCSSDLNHLSQKHPTISTRNTKNVHTEQYVFLCLLQLYSVFIDEHTIKCLEIPIIHIQHLFFNNLENLRVLSLSVKLENLETLCLTAKLRKHTNALFDNQTWKLNYFPFRRVDKRGKKSW